MNKMFCNQNYFHIMHKYYWPGGGGAWEQRTGLKLCNNSCLVVLLHYVSTTWF